MTGTKISVGQELVVSGTGNNLKSDSSKTKSKKSSNSSNVHVVKNGESLWIIAQKYSVTVNELKSANNLRSEKVSVGQKLQIPN